MKEAISIVIFYCGLSCTVYDLKAINLIICNLYSPKLNISWIDCSFALPIYLLNRCKIHFNINIYRAKLRY